MLRLSLNGQWVMRRITNRVSDKEGQNTAEFRQNPRLCLFVPARRRADGGSIL